MTTATRAAGVKFNDADLIGIPVRLTVSERTLPQAAVEVKARWEQERRLVPLGELEGAIREALEKQRQQLDVDVACCYYSDIGDDREE